MIHPFGRPEYINFLKSILFMARDSSSEFRQGHHTFHYVHKKYNRGSGRKRTNEQYGLRSAPSARRVVLWHFFVSLFVHFVDYRGRIFFAKLLQKLLGMPTHLRLSSSLPPSTDRCRLPLWISLRQLTLSGFLCQLPSLGSFANYPLWVPLPTALSGFLRQLTLSGFLCQLPSLGSFANCPLWVPSPTDPLWVPLPTALSGFLRQLTLSGFLCQLLSLASRGPAFPTPLPVSLEIWSPCPLFGFAPKQTKGSSAWRTGSVF